MWFLVLATGDVLLVSAAFAPWAILTTSSSGLPPSQTLSPVAVLWGAVAATPTLVGGPILIGWSLVYLCAALASAGLTVRLMRVSASSDSSAADVRSALIWVAICGFYGLFALLVLPALPLGYPYPHVSLAPGWALALGGAALAISGLAIVGPSRAR